MPSYSTSNNLLSGHQLIARTKSLNWFTIVNMICQFSCRFVHLGFERRCCRALVRRTTPILTVKPQKSFGLSVALFQGEQSSFLEKLPRSPLINQQQNQDHFEIIIRGKMTCDNILFWEARASGERKGRKDR